MTIAAPRRPRRLIITEPVPGGREIVTFGLQKTGKQTMWHPDRRYPWAWQTEPELRLLREFVMIVAAHPGDPDAMVAAFQSVLLREEAREQGHLSPADRRREGRPIYRMTDELRALFAQADPVRALVGEKREAGFVPGLAQLTESEMEAYWLHLHGSSRASIALQLVPLRRRRFGREAAVPLATVSQYLWRARVKLRRNVFRLPAESERSYLEALDAEEAEAEQRQRPVDAARAQALPADEEDPPEDDLLR